MSMAKLAENVVFPFPSRSLPSAITVLIPEGRAKQTNELLALRWRYRR